MLKFETSTKAEKPMKIYRHPLPTNTVEVSSKETSRVRLLTLELAQKKGVVDHKVQTTVVVLKEKGCYLKKKT
jgi:hypothetical protein